MSKALKELRRKTKRIRELEEKAKRYYLDNTDWSHIISMLTADEQQEYIDLMEELE